MRKINCAFVLVLFAAAVAIAQEHNMQGAAGDMLKPELGTKIGSCRVCGMDVYGKMLTRVEITVDDSVYHACGLGCAVTIMRDKNVHAIKVVDFSTGKLVNAKESHYVIDSNLVPARAMLPEFAFQNRSDAEAFVKIHSGRILDYDEMVDLAAKIHAERMNK